MWKIRHLRSKSPANEVCGYVFTSVCLSTGGGTHGRGHAWQGRGVCYARPPADTMRYSDTVNERSVRILLECILVTARKRSLGQGYIFTDLCHSVNMGVRQGDPLPGKLPCQGEPLPGRPPVRETPCQGDPPPGRPHSKENPPARESPSKENTPPDRESPSTENPSIRRTPLPKETPLPLPGRAPCQGDPPPGRTPQAHTQGGN